ncbi:MAG: DUF2752 domain-containing protein [Jatrophihabitantaceae bacterium]
MPTTAARTASPVRAVLHCAKAAPYTVAAGIGLGTATDIAFDPVDRHVPLCPFRAITGWWCPLCGGLRAVYSLAHGNLAAAVHDNVVLLACLPLLAVVWIDWVRRARAGVPGRRLNRPAVITVVLALTAFTIVRNLPFAAAIRP